MKPLTLIRTKQSPHMKDIIVYLHAELSCSSLVRDRTVLRTGELKGNSTKPSLQHERLSLQVPNLYITLLRRLRVKYRQFGIPESEQESDQLNRNTNAKSKRKKKKKKTGIL